MNGINVAKLSEEIQKNEGGLYLTKYFCDGIPHIGYGHNIQANPLDGYIEFYLASHGEITQDMADYLFDRDLTKAIEAAHAVIPVGTWFGLSPNRREVIIEMIFNMGLKSFLGFSKMLQAIIEGDCYKVASEMEDSDWFRNPLTTKRAKTMAWKWLEG